MSKQQASTSPKDVRSDQASKFDPDFGKSGFAKHLFRLRFRDLAMSQRAFAERFGLGFTTVRDVEQGLREPSLCFRILVEAIADNPARMAHLARCATTVCECGNDDDLGCCAARRPKA
ncbi:UNVERIFIED_ORG: DNA-binding XRE family transcriptional regulator [Sphingomonas sp. 1057]